MLTHYNIKRQLRANDIEVDETKFILAVSGGADSMALLHLFITMESSFIVAHCNFNLRGEESDLDQQLVQSVCQLNNIPFLIKSFKTEEFANENGISIEMAARDLRYEWFNELLKTETADYLITAHHQDDQVETFFLNLTRGTGLKGLTGMKLKSDQLLRPMLAYSRQDILSYCQSHHLEYRIDQSNFDNHHKRNHLRNIIIPEFEKLNPSFKHTILESMNRLSELENLLNSEIDKAQSQIITNENDHILIPKKLLENHQIKQTILFELLKDKGFNSDSISNITEALNGTPGKQFFTQSHRLIIDRYNLIVLPILPNEADYFYIDADQSEIKYPIHLKLNEYKTPSNFLFSTNPLVVHLDSSKINFPLLLRKWCEGDHFKPLGMSGFKKVSDFFIDKKFSLIDKENTYLLCNGEEIIWIVGHRIDDRFKITDLTKEVLEIELLVAN